MRSSEGCRHRYFFRQEITNQKESLISSPRKSPRKSKAKTVEVGKKTQTKQPKPAAEPKRTFLVGVLSFLPLTQCPGVCPPVRLEKARGGRGGGRRRRRGAGGRQPDPAQEGRTGRLRRRRRGGEHHGHGDEIPSRSSARHAEEVGRPARRR